MNRLLCAAIAVLLLLQGISTQVSEEENRKLRERICNDPFHSFLCQTVDPTKRKRYNAKPPQNDGNLLGDNSFPQQSRILPPQIPVPTTTEKTNIVLKTTLKPAQNPSPAQNILSAQNLLPEAAQNAPVILKPKLSEDDLCKHSFHSFLCNPAKNKRRLYNGQKSGPPPPPNSNLLNGENSFLLSTQLRPDPPKFVPEPKIEPDNSNDSPVFQAPTYLPPFDEKPEQNLFGDNSFLDPSIQLLPTTAKPQPITTRATTPRPTPRATTPRPTTPKLTTPRPTTPRPTTPRATTTTRQPITTRTTTEPNLDAAGAQNSGTQLRPEVAADNLCAHSFHSFLCDKPKQTKPRRIYNGRKSSPEDTNILGENSFQQSSRLLAPTTQAPKTTTKQPRTYAPYKPVTRHTTTPKPSSNLIGDNSFLSPTNLLPPTPQKQITIPTTPRPTTRPIPATPDPEVQPDAAQNPSVRLLPDASGTDDELCKHSFHSFLCTGGKTGGKRRVYNGQNSNILGANSFLDSKRLLPPSVQSARTTTYKPLFEEGSYIQSTNLRPELLNTAANTYLPPASYLPPQSKRSLRQNPNTANLFGASSNVDVTAVLPPPTSKPLPASLARGNHAPTTAPPPHTTEVEVQPAAAEDAPSVVVPEPEHHEHPPGGDHHHHDDGHGHGDNHGDVHSHGDHHGASTHAHGDHHGDSTHAHGDHHGGHGHGDHHAAGDHHHGAHGDHHHHHLDNISIEQLCRDPFHAFLCENVDTSKRRIYDGNPAQGTPSARERLQGLQGSSSDARSTHVNPPRNNGFQNSLPNSVLKSERPRLSAQPSLPHSPNPVTLPPQRDEILSLIPVATRAPIRYSSPDPVVIYTTTTRAPFIIDEPSQHNSQNEDTENLSLYIRRDNPILLGLLKSDSYVEDSQRTSVESNHRQRTPPQVPGAHLLEQPVQRLPVHRQRDPVPDAASPQVANRERRPLRRKARPHSVNPEARVNNQEYRFRENVPNPESANRRSDDVHSQEETPRQIKFGERLPRRKRLNSQEADVSIETPTNPAGFVRGPRGVASYLAATTPDVQCKEPFGAYRCHPGSLREKRMAKRKDEKEEKEDKDEKDERREKEKEDKEREKAEKEERKQREKTEKEERDRKRVRPMRRRGQGHMRDQAQGHESESGRGKPKAGQKMSEAEDVEDEDEDEEAAKESDEEEMEEVTEKHENMEDSEDDKKTTTEDPQVVYQRGIDEELQRRKEDEKNRKDELKRREDELEKRKEEMTRRNKEQEGRKAEAKRRKDESERRKVEERIRKEMLKRKKEQDKLDDDDADEAVEDVEDDDEEKTESELKEQMRVANEKIAIGELIRREAEVTRREGELKRREDELKRREEDGKSREAELKRRNDQEKKNAEELVRRDEEKIRIEEEMTRREEEDERRAAAKAKVEAAKRTK